MKGRAWGALFVLLALGTAWVSLRHHAQEPGDGAAPTLDLAPAAPAAPAAPFARATAVRPFALPQDHGPHFEYETEWWYYTGNLAAEDGRPFGFQLTFFRRGLSPGSPPPGPGLRTNQVDFAHLAITDVLGRRHQFFERWSRGAAGLAGAMGEPFAVWLEDWRADGQSADGSSVRLRAQDRDWGIELAVAATKPLVGHGDRGLSQKSAEPGNASYYIGYTRMTATGHVSAGGPPLAVHGSAWFDHEWSTSALGRGAVGWDWFSLQMDDGRELMYFQIRGDDGTVEPVSGGTLVEKDASTRRLGANEVRVEVLERWKSPKSGALYPVRWRVVSAIAGLELVVDRRLDAQELIASFTYWEGAVTLLGTSRGHSVQGVGYVELTGYAGSMHGVF
jgi:predicted secreted hydrolase